MHERRGPVILAVRKLTLGWSPGCGQRRHWRGGSSPPDRVLRVVERLGHEDRFRLTYGGGSGSRCSAGSPPAAREVAQWAPPPGRCAEVHLLHQHQPLRSHRSAELPSRANVPRFERGQSYRLQPVHAAPLPLRAPGLLVRTAGQTRPRSAGPFVIAAGPPTHASHTGAWTDRSAADDHEMVRRIDGRVWPPFYEQPWAPERQGGGVGRVSRYDLTRFNPCTSPGWAVADGVTARAGAGGSRLLPAQRPGRRGPLGRLPLAAANSCRNRLPGAAAVRQPEAVFMAEAFYDATAPRPAGAAPRLHPPLPSTPWATTPTSSS